MEKTKQETLPNICLKMTQIEPDLETTLSKIFEQTSNNIQVEKKEKYHQEIEITKQVFAKIKTKYGCILN